VGDTESGPIRLSFNPQLRVEFGGATVTSHAGLLLPRELDERLGLSQQRLFKTGGRLIRHARYFVLQLAESHLTSRLFRQILWRTERLAWHPT